MKIIYTLTRARRAAVVFAASMLMCGTSSADVHPNSDDKTENVYVGHFGEAITFSSDMSVRTRLVGEMEVVDFYSRLHHVDGHLVPFDPAKEKITPEFFETADLIELIVAPSSASNFATLDAVRVAKEAELRKQGVEFRVVAAPYPVGQLPNGSFEVIISKPYSLRQLYTQTGTYRFILTAKSDPGFDYYYRYVRMGLSDFISKSNNPATTGTRPSPASGSAEVPEAHIRLKTFSWLRFWLPLQLIVLIGVVAMRKSQSTRMGSALAGFFLFSNAGAMLSWVIGKWIITVPNLSPYWFAPTAVACALFVLPGSAIMKWVTERKLTKFGIVTCWLYAAILICGGILLRERTSSAWLQGIPMYSFIMGGVLAAPIGLLWGALSEAVAAAALALILLLGGATSSSAQEIPIGGPALDPATLRTSLEIRARMLLGSDYNIQSAEDLRPSARLLLRARGTPIYDYQRFEIHGILSNDDTENSMPGLFDGGVQPSHKGLAPNETAMPAWMQKIEHPTEDLAGLATDSGGKLSDAALEVIRGLGDKEINEIVAHSWGAEILYNAIFAGSIRPPRRLIICGVTESNWEKWKALSVYTGTQVIIYDNHLDPAAHSARSLHVANDAVYHFEITEDPAKLDGMWQIACQNIDCNEHHRDGRFSHKSYFGAPTHDRLAYYQKMIDDKVISQNVPELREAQDVRVNSEAQQEFDHDLANAREAIMAEDAKQRKDADDFVRSSADMAKQRKDADDFVRSSYEAAVARAEISATNEAMLAAARLDMVLNLKRLAINACDSPNTVTDRDADAMRAIVTYSATFAPAVDQVSAGMDGCAKDVFDRITAAARANKLGDGLSADWVRELGRYYAPEPEPVAVAPVSTPAPRSIPYHPGPSQRPCHWVTVSLDGRKECW